MVKGLILGILLGVIGIAGGVYWYFSSGKAPVAVTSADMPFEKQLARKALHAYLDKLPHPEPKISENEDNFKAGARIYVENCAVCHGVPEKPVTSIAEGMYPRPPQLFRGTGVTDDEAWESYWKVSGGIRMTGMPGFKGKLSEEEMWQVSVLVKDADKISPAVKTILAGDGTKPFEKKP